MPPNVIYIIFPLFPHSFSYHYFSLQFLYHKIQKFVWSEEWGRSSILRSILMIPMSTGMLFFLLMLRNCFLRIVFSLKMSGGQLEFSRAGDGCTMLFTDQSHISCSSGGH